MYSTNPKAYLYQKKPLLYKYTAADTNVFGPDVMNNNTKVIS